MFFVINKTQNTIIGSFTTINESTSYIKSITGNNDLNNFIVTQEVNIVTYISRISHVDGVCIYNNKDFWINSSHNVYDNYESHTVLDFLGNPIYKDRFAIEMDMNFNRISNVTTTADQVNYNINIGFEYISLFREETVNGDLGTLNGLDVAAKTANVIPLVTTGSFKEAAYVLGTLTPDEYLTTERLTKYRTMLLAADIITYQRGNA